MPLPQACTTGSRSRARAIASSIARIVGKGALSLGAAAVVLLAGELIARIACRHVTTTGDGFSYFSWRWDTPAHVRRNSWRYREREFSVAKTPGIYRIAVVGDSFTFGMGIEEGARYTNVLNRYLGVGRFEVLNFGRQGADTIDEVQMLKPVLRADPDFVLLQWFINDFEGGKGSGRPQTMRLLPWHDLDLALYRSSVLYCLASIGWTNLQVALGLPGYTYADYMRRRFENPATADSQEALDWLRLFIATCRAHHVGVGIVLFPELEIRSAKDYPFDSLHRMVLDVCDGANVRCVDLREVFFKQPDLARLRVNAFDAHPSALANHLAAQVLMEKFGPGWLADANTR